MAWSFVHHFWIKASILDGPIPVMPCSYYSDTLLLNIGLRVQGVWLKITRKSPSLRMGVGLHVAQAQSPTLPATFYTVTRPLRRLSPSSVTTASSPRHRRHRQARPLTDETVLHAVFRRGQLGFKGFKPSSWQFCLKIASKRLPQQNAVLSHIWRSGAHPSRKVIRFAQG